MPLPKKALRFGQLTHKTAGSAVPKSGHDVVKVEFTDGDGKERLGFYKPCDETYPPLLAKYSVAVSVGMRTTFGNAAAEERLVFNDKDEIIGTVSLVLPGFKPLLSNSDSLPLDEQEKNLVCPDVSKLLASNMAHLLILYWRWKNDDVHPGNIGACSGEKVDYDIFFRPDWEEFVGFAYSVFFGFDYDMCLYPITSIIKGSRWIHGILVPVPEKSMTLKAKNLDNFPILNGRTHWPTHVIPENLNLYKTHKAHEAFQALTGNPCFETANGRVYFQEQMFQALLHELITYDPDMIRARMEEYFGDIPLDYLSLPPEKSGRLEEVHGELFNKISNGKPFVDHMELLNQNEYNELYRAVVFYGGCEKNEKDVTVPSFAQFLQNKPSGLPRVAEWASAENSRIEKAREYQARKEDGDRKAEDLLSGGMASHSHEKKTVEQESPWYSYCIAERGQFSAEKIRQRYHKVFRDAHIDLLKDILGEGKSLVKLLQNELSKEPLASIDLTKPESSEAVKTLDTENSAITEAWQFMGSTSWVDETIKVDCDETSSLREGLIRIQKFFKELTVLSQKYYTEEELTPGINRTFANNLSQLILDCTEGIPELLGEHTSWAKVFVRITGRLDNYQNRIRLERHLIKEDAPLTSTERADIVRPIIRDHMEQDIIDSCFKTLFDWVDTLDRSVLNSYIAEAVDVYKPYWANITSWKYRHTEVKRYIKESTDENSEILAWILRWGETKSNSLNTILLKSLIPRMLDYSMSEVAVNLISVRYAFAENKFKAESYAEKAKSYIIAHTTIPSNLFYKTMKRWVSALDREKFIGLVFEAITDYEKKISFWTTSRRGEVKEYLKPEHSNVCVLGYIFCKGGIETNSLNTILYHKIIQAMQADISTDPDKKDDEEYQLMNKLTLEHIQQFMRDLRQFAKDSSYEQEKALALM
ncbi:hypothetical protein [Legionella spiritensis]|uniref:hypothetical protein n=1 Tax=Legionella spiritensis TaxID=452 RepID=UPI000F6BD90E|nr:hypothetical protein [Legionella spiritensis]VEG91557.1 Uncharacterised protein [Legionella spiritensis]